MLTCIPRSKQPSDDSPSIDHPPPGKPSSNASPTKQAIRSLSFQVVNSITRLLIFSLILGFFGGLWNLFAYTLKKLF